MTMAHKTKVRKARFRPRFGKPVRQFLAWCVHFYTALGLVAAAGIGWAVLADPPQFRLAFLLMLIAVAIDATDGTFARLVRVKEVLPGFDGRRLDDLVDWLTYTCLPLLVIWRAGLLAADNSWVLLVPLLASSYGFCQVSAKTDDGYFLGFPSYWNLVAFYLYMAQPPEWVSIALLVGLSVLTFVPARYLYATQRGRLNRLANLLGAVYAVLLVWILWRMPEEGTAGLPEDTLTRVLLLLSLFYPVFYLTTSWAISVRYLLRRAAARRAARSVIEEVQPG
jgi:phosphatidylcholine synthase